MNSTSKKYTALPINHNPRIAYLITLIIMLFMAVASVVGIAFQTAIYPTEELLRNFMPNDVVNLLIGVPILLGSMWLTRQEKLIGLLLWPGALLYVFYNYVAYIYGLPFNTLYPLYLCLVVLSAYTIIYLVASTDGQVVHEQLKGHVPERLAGGILSGFGILFILRVFAVMLLALINKTPIESTELAVLIADFLVSPAMISGGILLWRRKALGYVSGLGLLFQASMLFIGLIIFMILQPLITSAPFSMMDVFIVLIMGLVCIIPFGLYTRGILSTSRK
jgi:hypothetical protein